MVESRMWVVPGVFIPVWITLCLWGRIDRFSMVTGGLILLVVASVAWR